jgi:hypothetical protein
MCSRDSQPTSCLLDRPHQALVIRWPLRFSHSGSFLELGIPALRCARAALSTPVGRLRRPRFLAGLCAPSMHSYQGRDHPGSERPRAHRGPPPRRRTRSSPTPSPWPSDPARGSGHSRTRAASGPLAEANGVRPTSSWRSDVRQRSPPPRTQRNHRAHPATAHRRNIPRRRHRRHPYHRERPFQPDPLHDLQGTHF